MAELSNIEKNSEVIHDSNELIRNLYLAQKELIEATKLEAAKHERLLIECQKKTEEYQLLKLAEEETAKNIQRNNEILEKRLEIAEEILEALKINLEERPVEKSISQLSEILSGVRVIAELVAKELLKRIYTGISSENERNELMRALIDIGKSKPNFESNINLNANRDIQTKDINSTTLKD